MDASGGGLVPGWLLAEETGLHSLIMVEVLGSLEPGAADRFARCCLVRMAGRRDQPGFYEGLLPEFADQLVGEWWVSCPMDAMDACEALIVFPEVLAGADASKALAGAQPGERMAASIAARKEARRVEVRWCYGEIAKISGASDATAAVAASLVDDWPGSWSELLAHAGRLAS